MGNRPENTLGTTVSLDLNPLRAIDLVCNESFAADRRWFFTDQEMREYLCGQRAAYANDVGVVRDADGVIGTWYFVEFSAKYADPAAGPSLSDWDKAFKAAEPMSLGETINAHLSAAGHDRMVAKVRERFINSGNTPDSDDWKHAPYDGDVLPEDGEESGDRNYVMSQEEYDRHFDELASNVEIDREIDAQLAEMQRGPVILTGEELLCVGSDEGCQCEECSNLTEEQRMGQAGMSDEEIAGVFHVDKLSSDLAEARDTVASLLGRIDNLCGADLHCLGHTPSWYVEAAAISCGVVLKDDVVEDDWREREMANAKAFDEALAAAKKRLNGLPF